MLKAHWLFILTLFQCSYASALKTLAPIDVFERTQAVYDHLKLPPEKDDPVFIQEFNQTQTLEQAHALLRYLDPGKEFQHFFKVIPATATTNAQIKVYQDRISQKVEDFTIELARDSKSVKSVALLQSRLEMAARSSESFPLSGLRIALDPGHMGGKEWDDLTGKYVRDAHGNYLSEGVMALQVSLLLERELRNLGADVLITHRSLAPVTKVPYQKLPIRELAYEEVREQSVNAWFFKLLQVGPPGGPLFQAFDNSPHVHGIFSEAYRNKYFIHREDLDARSDAIEKFGADITLVIHFDTNDPPGNSTGLNPRGYDKTKTFVAGAFEPMDLGSRVGRRYFAKHWFDPEAWEASLRLSRSVVKSLSKTLGIPREQPEPNVNIVDIEPGVISRNLRLTRNLRGHAVSYVEVLHYNAPKEFHALLKADHPLEIDGVNHPYSDRIAEVVQALRTGVIEFVQSYRK